MNGLFPHVFPSPHAISLLAVWRVIRTDLNHNCVRSPSRLSSAEVTARISERMNFTHKVNEERDRVPGTRPQSRRRTVPLSAPDQYPNNQSNEDQE